MPSQIINMPANITMTGQSTTWQSNYATLGVGLTNSLVLYDGINECGLAGDLQVLMECGRASADDLEQRGLQPILGEELVTYILTQCKDVAAVKELAATLALVDQPYSFMGQTAQIPAHYTFIDPTGAMVVLESTDNGTFKLYDSVGVLTNSPEYDYHTTNLRNYISLDNLNKAKKTVGADLELEPIENGTGHGFFGMPGDYTSPSRFVRATLIAKNIDPFASSVGIPMLYNTFSSVMIPKGLGRTPQHETVTDYTQYWSGYDLTARKLYVQDYACPTFTSKALDQTTDTITYTPIDLTFKTNEI
ncbi:linear amide C-N hydrolase [Loigolactobacillus coryniformis]|nr:linear amide C-N hydrolase [Loigolactobacillus coryniformis]MDC4187035.1 linear amide C-N hydrolase [Loigolactobacillus coryniformis]